MHHLSMLLLSVLGFACLALAMERHQEDWFARPFNSSLTTILRAVGWALLCGSLALALCQPLWAVGLVAWFGHLSAGAGVVLATLVAASRLAGTRRR
ncbi:MAG: DUF3325 domain-containing protein [Pusillimonas sp.]